MTTMLRTAIKARLPLIAVHTDDPINVGKVLEHYSDVPVERYQQVGKRPFVKDSVAYTLGESFTDHPIHAYTEAAKSGSTLIVVNPEDAHPAMFDAGVMALPDSMIRDFIAKYAHESTDRYALEAALRGLSYKAMIETAKLSMTESGEFTADSVLRVRRERTVLSSGLQLVDTNQFFYMPNAELEQWLDVDGRLFTANVAPVVRPRGLLFYGDPGTGKTSGAKYLAQSLGIPLYLLDVGSTMQKYVGETEKTFANAISQVEALAPCVLLLDEVEKVLSEDDDSGVSRRVLGMLLWWLQEHGTHVLTVMTTNDLDSIPPELIRPGRIDSHVRFVGLDEVGSQRLARALRDSLTNVCAVAQSVVEQDIRAIYRESGVLRTHAEITQRVLYIVKAEMAAKLKKE